MSLLLYIHGFLSSPLSHKALQTQAWLRDNHPQINYCCPELPAYPAESMEILESVLAENSDKPIYLLGSSLGGFYATYLSQSRNLKAVLINPAVRPYNLMQEYLHTELKNYHNEKTYRLNSQHMEQLRHFETPIKTPENVWLLTQTGDETLDYRQAVAVYSECKQLVEHGGDHSFQNFEQHLPAIIEFFIT